MKIDELLEGREMLGERELKRHLRNIAVGGALIGGVIGGLNRPVERHPADFGVDTTVRTAVAPKPDKPKQESAVSLLAKTIWGEARREGVKGMRAVAHVIKNRANSDMNAKSGYRLYGHGIIGVIKNDKAFSAWNDEDVNRKLLDNLSDDGSNLDGPDKEAFMKAKMIAAAVISGEDSEDPTNGADHYHAVGIKPEWSKKRKHHPKPVVTARIGNHIFYKKVDTPEIKKKKRR